MSLSTFTDSHIISLILLNRLFYPLDKVWESCVDTVGILQPTPVTVTHDPNLPVDTVTAHNQGTARISITRIPLVRSRAKFGCCVDWDPSDVMHHSSAFLR